MEESTEQSEWSTVENGRSQLRELNAMERSQDSSYWLSSAVLIVANAVLVAEFFRQEDHYLARLAISIVGLMVAVVMVMFVNRARLYRKRWLEKAKVLERDLGIPLVYSVWEETGLPGLPASQALSIAAMGFVILWVVCGVFAAWKLIL